MFRCRIRNSKIVQVEVVGELSELGLGLIRIGSGQLSFVPASLEVPVDQMNANYE